MKTYKLTIQLFFFSLMLVAQGVLAQESGNNDHIILEENHQPQHGVIIIDGRPQELFKASHIPGAINIMEAKFGEYLGKTVQSETRFYLVAADLTSLNLLIHQADSIGYSENLEGAFMYTKSDGAKMDVFDKADFISHPDKYTIIDIRSEEEFEQNSFFQTALNFPLDKLQEEAHNIPTDKPIVVHCATGYRSTIGSSIIFQHIKNQQVLDMGGAIKDFSKKE